MIYQLKMLVFQSDVRLPEAKRRCSSSILRIGYPKILVHHVPRPKNVEKYVFPDKPRFYIVGCIRNVPWHNPLCIITYHYISMIIQLLLALHPLFLLQPPFQCQKKTMIHGWFFRVEAVKTVWNPMSVDIFCMVKPICFKWLPSGKR